MNSEYNEAYLQTHDIDWFCRIGNTAMHFASNGGAIPKKVNNREVNSKIQNAVAMMEDVVTEQEQIMINRQYVNARLGENVSHEAFNRYVESFVAMAKKGFVSFDRRLEGDSYMWISKPANSVDVAIDELPRYSEDICRRYASDGDVVHVDCLDQEQ